MGKSLPKHLFSVLLQTAQPEAIFSTRALRFWTLRNLCRLEAWVPSGMKYMMKVVYTEPPEGGGTLNLLSAEAARWRPRCRFSRPYCHGVWSAIGMMLSSVRPSVTRRTVTKVNDTIDGWTSEYEVPVGTRFYNFSTPYTDLIRSNSPPHPQN